MVSFLDVPRCQHLKKKKKKMLKSNFPDTRGRLEINTESQVKTTGGGGKRENLRTASVMERRGVFDLSRRFQWENDLKHFITGRYLLKCKHRLGISAVKW